jgi:hypothetical protein
MTPQEELEYQEEYETREVYILSFFKGYEIDWSIGKLTKKWKGTQKEYDKLLKDYTDRGLVLIRKDIHNEEPYWWNPPELDTEEIKRRDIFNKRQFKQNTKRLDSYRYLKSGY